MKCQVSPLYGKDNNKNIHFYCEYCDKEMDYDEDRKCTVEPGLCTCGNKLGSSDYSVSICLQCEKKI